MKKTMYNKLKCLVLLAIFEGSVVFPWEENSAESSQTVANTQLPTNGQWIAGGPDNNAINQGGSQPNNTLQITQKDANAVIKWQGGFNIGANGTVNFDAVNKNNGEFNTLNYDATGKISQIYGKINANNGHIYIVNPSGVQIGNSAQINVGSLYVSNAYLDEDRLTKFDGENIDTLKDDTSKISNAELMSLGNINAPKVTFEGDGRIIIDTDRLKNGTEANTNFVVKTTNADNVVLGYDAYDGTYKDKNKTFTVQVKGQNTNVIGYMWVRNGEQLQAINTSLSGKYALRNSIDMTQQTKFTSLGKAQAFSGTFDGLDYNIFGLNINSTDDYTGLFAQTDGATLRDIRLISGSVTGAGNVGAVVGKAANTTIDDVVNTLYVKGTANNVGGIVGIAENTTITNAINSSSVDGMTNVGGIVGNINDGSISGTTYNLGHVAGKAENVGGIAGTATSATIGNTNTKDTSAFQIYNNLNVTGTYNVGGIVGAMTGTTVQNVKNLGHISATGSTTEEYTYHTDNPNIDDNKDISNRFGKVNVSVANVGGIVGKSAAEQSGKQSTIVNALNTGNISSTKAKDKEYYNAGNIGGIVGRAENTTITNVENKENYVYGAHNVGGVVGYYSGGTITNAINNGGDIMATGARKSDGTGFGTELIRKDGGNGDTFIIGNMGGIVGYMKDGDTQHSYIKSSSNRGTVHSLEILEKTDDAKISDSSKAANAGGIVGKVDRGFSHYVKENNLSSYLEDIKKDTSSAAISDSYNTGNVQGYAGVGGIAGFMYNGEIANSYNIGNITTTRLSAGKDAVNMGGILGDTMERSPSRVVLYNVYNKGQIGDEKIHFYGRHVGGVVGRFSGIIDTAYNSGNIYNGSAVTGGVVGYWLGGTIQNVFNVGNITTVNHNINNTTIDNTTSYGENTAAGGIVGMVRGYTSYINEPSSHTMTLQNAYNLGTIRAFGDLINGKNHNSNSAGGIIGSIQDTRSRDVITLNINNVYTTGNIYAASRVGDGAYNKNNNANEISAIYNNASGGYVTANVQNSYYIKPDSGTVFTEITGDNLNDATSISFDDAKDNHTNNASGSFKNFDTKIWRFYNGTTPILNAFMPKLSQGNNKKDAGLNEVTIQFGTAYNPFLNIIKTNDDVTITGNYLNNWDSIAVYGGSLTLQDFTDQDNLMYGGTIYSDGALSISGHNQFGAASKLYGSSVTIDAAGDVKINGTIKATGNGDNGYVTISGKSVETYGAISSAKAGETVAIDGIQDTVTPLPPLAEAAVNNPVIAMPTVASQYAHTTDITATDNGDINITAKDDDVNLYYGNMHNGLIESFKDINVTANTGKIFIDSDVRAGQKGTINLKGNTEMVLDISNIGKSKTATPDAVSKESNKILHDFLKNTSLSFTHTDSNNTTPVDGKVAVDMSDKDGIGFNFNQYDITNDDGTKDTFKDAILAFTKNKNVYTWIKNASQLNAIQAYAEKNKNSNIHNFNFALKNDLDASEVKKYQAITDYNGIFDGRGNRIIDLKSDTSLFTNLNGTVQNLNVYASTFKGGAIADTTTQYSKIDAVSTLGNTITANNDTVAGGLVGTNMGTISNSSDIGTIQGGDNVTSGGIAGINEGTISNSQANSDVTDGKISGGIVGSNTGSLSHVGAFGVTKGNTVGGIVGENTAQLDGGYNESVVVGKAHTGGIAGDNKGSIRNVANAMSVTGQRNVGGLVGTNYGTVDGGRNNGTITGEENVGGLVGTNEKGATLENLNNDDSANITGNMYVGGIAGANSGTIDAKGSTLQNTGVITGQQYVGGVAGKNTGEIKNTISNITLHVKDNTTDAMYFGGVVGLNEGKIQGGQNTGDIHADKASYVGGIIGRNNDHGTLTAGTDENGTEQPIGNTGNVTGKNYVGGIIGQNDAAVDGVTATNSGVVKATAGGAGGLVGVNNGNITNGYYVNNGTVSGTGTVGNTTGTGGIFGINSGSITESTLINGVGSTVSGQENVGGLIGFNTGNVIGSRDANGNYYKNQLVNNGTVIGGTITPTLDADGNVTKVEKTISEDSKNIGGLIGDNAQNGKLTAGYNTGTVQGGSNVGGIVGTNAGIVSQVFSTLANGQLVKGKTYVGGVVGQNETSGKLQDSYAAFAVTGTRASGNVVGTNAGTVKNVYSQSNTGNLIGTGSGTIVNSVSYSDADKGQLGITVLADEKAQKDTAKYTGFDFNTTWKNYDGYSKPMLKVFLTKATVTDGKGNEIKPTDLKLNTSNQSLTVKTENGKAVVYLGDKFVGYVTVKDSNGVHNLNDYLQTQNGSAADLLQGTTGKNAGEIPTIWSLQINTNGKDGNPNYLGYDIEWPGLLPLTGDWDWLYKDYPWDKIKNFRERRAELHYVDGGVFIEQ